MITAAAPPKYDEVITLVKVRWHQCISNERVEKERARELIRQLGGELDEKKKVTGTSPDQPCPKSEA